MEKIYWEISLGNGEVQMNNPAHQKSNSFSSFSDKFLLTKTAEELKLNNEKDLYKCIKYK